MRDGDKRVVNIKDGEMRGREERGRGRLLSFSLRWGRLLSFPLHRERDKRRGGRDSYLSPFIGREIKREEGRLLSFSLHRDRDERRGGGDSYPSPFIVGKIKGKEIGSSEMESRDGQLIASTVRQELLCTTKQSLDVHPWEYHEETC